jgi:hypothetical protein
VVVGRAAPGAVRPRDIWLARGARLLADRCDHKSACVSSARLHGHHAGFRMMRQLLTVQRMRRCSDRSEVLGLRALSTGSGIERSGRVVVVGGRRASEERPSRSSRGEGAGGEACRGQRAAAQPAGARGTMLNDSADGLRNCTQGGSRPPLSSDDRPASSGRGVRVRTVPLRRYPSSPSPGPGAPLPTRTPSRECGLFFLGSDEEDGEQGGALHGLPLSPELASVSNLAG